MEDDCVILGTFEKNNKVDDTINVFDVEADAQEESKKISNPFTKKKLKRNSSVRGECKNKKKKKKKEMGRAVNELPTTSNINISRSYITAESHYSISETEIHHLVGGVSMVNRGTNTDPERNVTSDDPIMCCCVKGHKSLPGYESKLCMKSTLPVRNSEITSELMGTATLDQYRASPELQQRIFSSKDFLQKSNPINPNATSQTSMINSNSNLPSINTIFPHTLPRNIVINDHTNTNDVSNKPHTGKIISGESRNARKNYTVLQNQGNVLQRRNILASTSSRQTKCDSTSQPSLQLVIENPYDKVVPWLNNNTTDLPSLAPENRIDSTIQHEIPLGFKHSPISPRGALTMDEKKLMIKTIFEYKKNLLVSDIDENTIKSMKNLIESKLQRPISVVAKHWCCLLKPLIMSGLYGISELNIHAGLFTNLIFEKYESIHDVDWQKLVLLWPFHNEVSLRDIVQRASLDKRVPAEKKLYEKLRILIPYYKKKTTSSLKHNERDEILSYYANVIQNRK